MYLAQIGKTNFINVETIVNVYVDENKLINVTTLEGETYHVDKYLENRFIEILEQLNIGYAKINFNK